jgi:DNA/RNA-binding domain of Phe-tRNA-synthetase-like protein
MKFRIKKEIFNNFAGLIVGVILAKNINNKGESQEINELLQNAENKAIKEFSKLESPGKHSHILPWREAYKKFGSDPHKYHCSSEALVRQVLKGRKIRHINKLVDLYNYISLKYVLTVGGEDLDKIKGDLILNFAKGDELFVRLGGIENEPPLPGEVVYKDEEGIICRRWNWREADRTKLTKETKNAIIIIEGLPPIAMGTVEASR